MPHQVRVVPFVRGTAGMKVLARRRTGAQLRKGLLTGCLIERLGLIMSQWNNTLKTLDALRKPIIRHTLSSLYHLPVRHRSYGRYDPISARARPTRNSLRQVCPPVSAISSPIHSGMAVLILVTARSRPGACSGPFEITEQAPTSRGFRSAWRWASSGDRRCAGIWFYGIYFVTTPSGLRFMPRRTAASASV